MFKALGALAMAEAGVSVRRGVTVYALYLLATVILVAAIVFALVALHAVLAVRYDPVTASLYIAGGLLLAAILVFAIAALLNMRRRRHSALATTALVAAPVAAGAMASRPVVKLAMLGSVLLLGAAVGRELRK